jgi:hypothetical protein
MNPLIRQRLADAGRIGEGKAGGGPSVDIRNQRMNVFSGPGAERASSTPSLVLTSISKVPALRLE